nr:MAG TPA: hypothetical protein [Caudoviricetes sp.]
MEPSKTQKCGLFGSFFGKTRKRTAVFISQSPPRYRGRRKGD